MKYVDFLLARYPALAPCRADIEATITRMIHCYESGGKVLTCGNGGSAADADHIVGELMKGFCKKRPLTDAVKSKLVPQEALLGAAVAAHLQMALPAINLCAHTALSSAFANDVNPAMVFAQQAMGYCNTGDILLGITTSGNSQNVLAAGAVVAAKGGITLGLTGAGRCKMDEIFDCVIHVPQTETYKVQELHLPVYHAICLEVEEHFYKA